MEANEPDLGQLWKLVLELTEQLGQNRAAIASLQAQAGSVNVRKHSFVSFFSVSYVFF